jgi:hypothetical protein
MGSCSCAATWDRANATISWAWAAAAAAFTRSNSAIRSIRPASLT